MKPSPLPWQKSNLNAIIRALADYGVCFDTSSTGAGKTYQTLFAAEDLGFTSITVLCTASGVPVWEECAALFGIPVRALTYQGALQACMISEYYFDDPPENEEETAKMRRKRVKWAKRWREGLHPPERRKLRRRMVRIEEMNAKDAVGGWARLNQEWKWTIDEDSLLVFDEAHKLGGATSKFSKLSKAAKDQDLDHIYLSATLADTPLRMRAFAYAADLCPWSSSKFNAWCLLNGCDYEDYRKLEFHGDREDILKIKGAFGDRMTGINTNDVPGFPKSNIITVSVPIKGRVSLDDEYANALRSMEEEDAETEGVAAMRARQLSELGKVPWMVDKAKELIDEGLSVVLFTAFVESGERLAKELGCAFVSGKTKKTRTADLAAFQSNRTDLLVVMVDAGGESINLHDLHGKPRATIISPHAKATALVQVFGRCPRAEAVQKTVTQYVVFARGSAVEATIRSRLRMKTDNIEALTDNDLSIMPAKMVRAENLDEKACNEVANIADSQPMSKERTPKPPQVEKSEHSRCSPSNLKNLLQCPHYEGSKHETLDDMHPNTVEGLGVHLLVELYFDESKDPEHGGNLKGDDIILYERYKDHEEILARVDYAIDFAEEALVKRFNDADDYDLLTEPRLHTPHPHTYGRVDLLAIKGERAIILDWKDGMGWQGDAEDNPQGHAYVLGVFHTYPDVEEVEVYFVYTRREEVTKATFTRKDHYQAFLDMVVKVNRNFDAVQMNGAEMYQKGDACEYCTIQTTCPIWTGDIQPAFEAITPSGFEAPTSWNPAELCERPEEMVKVLNLGSFFEKYFKEIKAVAKSMVEDDDYEIPGYQLIESNSGLKCSNPDGAFEVFCEAFDYDDETIREIMEDIGPFLVAISSMSAPKLAKAMAKESHQRLGLSVAKADKHWRERMLEDGVSSEGTAYSYLKKGS